MVIRDELQDAIAQMLAHNGPVLVNAHVTKEETVTQWWLPAKKQRR